MASLENDPVRASLAFGKRVREVRKREGMSQENLAGAAGVHATSIGRLERGDREPRLTTVLRVARGLEVPPGELLDELGK